MKLKKPVLKIMMEDLKSAPLIYQPSIFWQKLNKAHMDKLNKNGFKNFKQTISKRYFNGRLFDIMTHQMPIVILEILRGNMDPIFTSKTEKLGKSAHVYRIYTAYLYDFVKRIDKLGLLAKLAEPNVGNPVIVNYKNSQTSQDLCNSVHEFYSSIEGKNRLDYKEIAEIGSGYGRLAFIFLKTLPKVNYTIIDLPPALNIAQEYLSQVFPDDKIFYYRSFEKFNQVKKEFAASRIRFLMPHQIELLPDKMFDLFLSVSTFHEMTRPQIDNYFKHINRLTGGFFYFKQYIVSRVLDNWFINMNQYPVSSNWTKIYKRVHRIQLLFFEALYRI